MHDKLRVTRRGIFCAVFLLTLTFLIAPAWGQPNVSATMRDQLVIDNDGDNEADRGDTIRYTVDISNSGAASATGVNLSGTLDPNTSLGAINVSPLAIDDAYATVGNVQLLVNTPGQRLLDNDIEFLGDTFGLLSFDAASVQGGQVAVNPDGSFAYDPPAGFQGVDQFSYTINDSGGLTNTGTVSITVAGMVWFVDNAAAGGGDGRFTSPFNSLAPLNGAGGVGDADGTDEYIFVYQGSGAYDGGIELESNQHLVGEGSGLTVAPNLSIPAAGDPIVGNSGGDVVQLAANNTITGLTLIPTASAGIAGSGADNISVTNVDIAIGGATSTGVDLTNQGGTFTFTGGTISGTSTGAGVNISGGAADIDFSGVTINKTNGTAVAIANTSAGTTIDFMGGSISGTTGQAVRVQNSTGGGSFRFDNVAANGAAPSAIQLETNAGGATFTFNELANITTSAGDGLIANSSGVVNIANSTAPSIDAAGGAAVDLTNTTGQTNGASGWTFASLASTGSPTQGVRLDTIDDDFTVSGTTDIDNSTLAGIDIRNSAAAVTFGRVEIQDAGGGNTAGSGDDSAGIFLSTNTGSFAITGGGFIDFSADNDDHGIEALAVGDLTIMGLSPADRFTITGAGMGVDDILVSPVYGPHGILAIGAENVLIDLVAVDDIGQGNAGEEDAIHLRDTISSVVITNSVIGDNVDPASSIPDGDGIHIVQETVSPASIRVGVDSLGAAAPNSILGGFETLRVDFDGLALTSDVRIENNTFEDWGTFAGDGTGISVVLKNRAGQTVSPVSVTIDNNTLTGVHSSNISDAISVEVGEATAGADLDVAISNNTISGATDDQGITLSALGDAGANPSTVNAIISGNSITGPVLDEAIRVQLQGSSNAAVIHALIEDNSALESSGDSGIYMRATGNGTINALVRRNDMTNSNHGLEIDLTGSGAATVNVNYFDNFDIPLVRLDASDFHTINLGCLNTPGCPVTIDSTTMSTIDIANMLNHNDEDGDTFGNIEAPADDLEAADIQQTGPFGLPWGIIDSNDVVFTSGGVLDLSVP